MNLYEIKLLDLATPSFVSSFIPYIGTREEIEDFIQRSTQYDYLKVWCEDQNTKEKDFYFPKKIEKIKETSFCKEGEQIFLYKNVWDCESKIYYKDLFGKYVYYKKEKKYFRAFYIESVTGLSYIISGDEMRLYTELPENIKNVYHALNSNNWGNKNIEILKNLDSDKHYFSSKKQLTHTQKSILGYTDMKFNSKNEMLKDMENPKDCHFELFINDYFADG